MLLASITTRLPLLSSTVIVPGPSPSVTRCPAGVSSTSFSCPCWSSSVTTTPFFERMRLKRLPSLPSSAGAAALPFHSPPSTSG